jgi:hypothetical protein
VSKKTSYVLVKGPKASGSAKDSRSGFLFAGNQFVEAMVVVRGLKRQKAQVLILI